MGMTNAMYDSQLMSNVVSASYDTWTELLDNDKLLNEQYKVLAGRMPSAYNEVVVMVNKDNEISDYSLYCMGLMDSDELVNAVKSAMSNNNEKVDFTSKLQTYTYDELLGLEFRLVTNPEFYEKENGIWTDKSDDKIYMTKVVEDAEPIKVVGIIKPEENSIMSSSSSSAIGYTHELTEYLVNKVNDSEVVKEQKSSPDTDIFTGKEFAKDEDKKAVTMDDIKAYIATLPEEQQAEIMSQLQQAQQMGMTEQQIADAFAKQMSTKSEATYDGNMTLLGVASLDEPSMISIYPKNFDAKEKIEEIISTYNDKVKADGNENLKIEYTDIVGLMMTSVSTIIDAISVILIAFVAISLVVSSIMIGIITYISVLERTKEIGILRAMGASKRDISRVFNAETLIVGFAAGAIGIGVTLLLLIPANAIVYNLTGISGMCVLPWQGAVILVIISMLLTLIAGLIPSHYAAKKDPVLALRSE